LQSIAIQAEADIGGYDERDVLPQQFVEQPASSIASAMS